MTSPNVLVSEALMVEIGGKFYEKNLPETM